MNMQVERRQPRRVRKPVLPYREACRLAYGERRLRVEWLGKPGQSEEAGALAEKLARCTRQNRCKSGACPVCHLRAQVGLSRAISDLARVSKEPVFVLTVVPESSTAAVGKLGVNDHENHTRRLKRALRKAEIHWLAGGTDFSLNEDVEGRFDPYWCPHLFALGSASDPDRVRQLIKAQYAGSERIPRPVKLEPWDGAVNALLYTFKGRFFRRENRPSQPKENFLTRRTRSYRDTASRELRVAEKLELWLHLDRIGLQHRVFTLGCELHANKHSTSLRLIG